MLEVWTKFISAVMLSLYGFYAIKKLTKSEVKLLNVKSILYLLTLCIVTVYFHKIKYTGTHTIAIFALQIIIYKVIFNISTEESLIACGILMMLTILGDVFCGLLLRNFYSINEIRNNGYIGIIANIIVIALGIAIIKVKYILKQLQIFYNNTSKSKSISNILFTILLIIGLSSLSQNTTKTSGVNSGYLINIMIMLIFFVLTYLFIRSKNSYDKLNYEYESMFNYVQNFEDWIEKEQLNRHEYKNQLAVLRCLTSEKKVKDKIDEILEDSINVEGEVVHQLKTLLSGGIKGLMYYKSAIAQKNKIDLTVNISLELHSILSKLSEKEVKVLCHLIGIYFDNAIEAAKETRKKKVLIEIYEIKDRVTFVFSNTFKKAKNFDDRNKKGVSTKGEGHGNGLYYASKLIGQNSWLSQKQEVIDKYYIQQIIVTQKNDHK